jgi:hypothetical protein
VKSALGSFIILPLLGIALVATRFGFRAPYVLAASVVGEIAGLFLYAAYNRWKVGAVLSGLASGSIAYRGTQGPRGILAGLLMFAALGLALGICVLVLRRIMRNGER